MTTPLALSRRFRSLAPAGVCAAALLLSGCGVSVVGHRLPSIGGGEKARAEARPDKVAEARAQAALAPAEPYWPYRTAELYAEADSLADAETALRAALSRDPGYAPALALQSKLWWKAGRHAEAIQALEAARARPGAFPDGFPPVLLAALALHYDAIGQGGNAAAATRLVAKPDPGREGAAIVYLRLRGSAPDSAAPLARAVVDHDWQSPANQNNYGITKLRAGDPDAARKAFLAAIERDPKLPGPYYNLAILEKYWALDDGAAAKWLSLYRERASDDPDRLVEAFAKQETKPVAEKGIKP